MALASGAHVKIGSYEFDLDETVEAGSVFPTWHPHYRHSMTPLTSSRAGMIIGMTNTDSIRPERLVWSMDDWIGGEGNRNWNPDAPNLYNFAYGMNPRIKGQITGRPSRTLQYVTPNVAANNDVRDRGYFQVAGGALWYAGSRDMVINSTDMGVTWNTVTQANIGLNALNSSYRITATAGDSEYLYYAAYYTDHHVVQRLATSGAATNCIASTGADAPYAGLAIFNGKLFTWTGRKLAYIDTTAAMPQTTTKVFDTGVDPLDTRPFSTSWWGGIVNAENRLFFFYSAEGDSNVYEYTEDKNGYGSASPMWHAPYGFTIKAIGYQNGVLYMTGHWGGDGSSAAGRGALYTMKLSTREPVFTAYFRKQNNMNLQMQNVDDSYGEQVIVTAAKTGRIFLYDYEQDGVSELDDIATSGSGGNEPSAPRVAATDATVFIENDHRIADVVTMGQYRHVMIYRPGSGAATDASLVGHTNALQLLSYSDDEESNRQAGTSTADYSVTLESGYYDYGLPYDRKALMGFDVLFAPLTTGQQFKIEYAADGGAFATAATLTSASADAAKGRTYIQVSDGTTTTRFTRIKVRITVTGQYTGGTGYQPPIIYNVATEAQLLTYEETWDLIVRLKNDQTRQKTGKRQNTGSAARDWLITTIQNKAVVTFLDGYRYKLPGNYTTHTVTIENPEDIIIRGGEGSMKITLRAVPS